MKNRVVLCKSLFIVLYTLFLYQLWHLCQYGGIKRHSIYLAALGILILICFICLFKFKTEKVKKNIFIIELVIVLLVSGIAGGMIIYSAIPYHGALSWKIDEWQRKKEVTFVHNSIKEDGIDGIFKDIQNKVDLPKELYVSNSVNIEVNRKGQVSKVDAFLYGKKNGKTYTYLISYDENKSQKITIWINGSATTDYSKDKKLQPMFDILKQVPWKERMDSLVTRMTYKGKTSIQSRYGLVIVGNTQDIAKQLDAGGQLEGYCVSFQSHNQASYYLLDPQYISQYQIDQQNQEQDQSEAKNQTTWTTSKDGSMYFYLNNHTGWRLVVLDAAAGSRFYGLEMTKDGKTFETINDDPFHQDIGVCEGLLFFNDQDGILGLSGASESHSTLYITHDGGHTLTAIQFPLDQVTNLPQTANQNNYKLSDYCYYEMPVKNGNQLTVKVKTSKLERDAILFISQDSGKTWSYSGVEN